MIRFTFRDCPYYPCHKVPDSFDLNCIHCLCPLYHLVKCPGNPTTLESGIRDCSNCLWIHNPRNDEHILKLLSKGSV